MNNAIPFLRFIAIFYAVFTLIITSQAALGATGIVVLEDTPGCDYFVVETEQGFTLLEWYGGVASIWKDDVVFGDIESYGFKKIYVDNRGEMRVWVEDYWTSEDDVLDFFIPTAAVRQIFKSFLNRNTRNNVYTATILP